MGDDMKQEPPRASAPPSDDELAAMLIATIPGTALEAGSAAAAPAIREIILRAITHERDRCVRLCLAIRNNAIKTGRFAMLVVGNYHAENQGDHPDAQAAAAMAEQSNLIARTFDGMARRIRLAPGACPACLGTKQAPSKSIRTAEGAPVLVECEACKEASPAAGAAEASDG